jgi:hypothetical protein
MTEKRPIVYVCVKMTGRYCDELVAEAKVVERTLRNYGFDVLHPVLIENVPNVHELLEQTDPSKLQRYWDRDKECLQECHLVLDYMSCNKSDGVGVELGLARFTYWKPVVRVFPNAGICISKLEYDDVFDSLTEAVWMMVVKFGTTGKILRWRIRMLNRSFFHFLYLQMKFIGDLL